LKVLDELEQNECPFTVDFDLSSESDDDEDDHGNDENYFDSKKHPKVCGRQDNIMPSGRLYENLEDINCELMKRADSNASNYQPSPKTTHRLLSLSGSKLSSDDLIHRPLLSPNITP
jgi:hypothetical protein